MTTEEVLQHDPTLTPTDAGALAAAVNRYSDPEHLCPDCGQKLKEGDGFTTPVLYCDVCGSGWNTPEEVPDAPHIAPLEPTPKEVSV